MLRLKKFLCVCFGLLALMGLAISIHTVPFVFHHPHLPDAHRLLSTNPHAIHSVRALSPIVVFVLIKLLYVMPTVLAFLYGMAWWTVKKGKKSAGGWAISTSLAILLHSIPFFVVTYYVWAYAPRGAWIGFLAIDGLLLAHGVPGLVAFAYRGALAKLPLEPAEPPRIAGDGTSRLLDWTAWLLAFAGVLAGLEWWDRWSHTQNLPSYSRGFPLSLLIMTLLITTALHELGHTAAGLALGMKLRAFIVGPFQWRIRDGRWKFQFLLSKFFSGGMTSVAPTIPEQHRWNEICMIAAGPLASLLTGVISLCFALTAKGRPYEMFWGIFAVVATFSLMGFALNLVPVRPEALYSDGAQIYQLLKRGPWADLHQVFNVADSTAVTPLRPRNFDIQAIQRLSISFTKGRQALLLRLLATSHFLDSGMIPQARDSFAQAEAIYHESASDIPAELHFDFVFDSAYLRRDAASARQWWDLMEAKKPTHLGVDYWLARSALLWIENHNEEAREAWNKTSALAQKLPTAGTYEFDRYRVGLLGAALNASPATNSIPELSVYSLNGNPVEFC